MSSISPAGSGASEPGYTDGAGRRERAAIAAQACETCRARKSKCDERRPKCGLCVRVGAECRYREPQPTKKDKTMVFMLDALNRIEGKVDRIGKIVTPDAGQLDAGSSHYSPFSGRLSSVSSAQMVQGSDYQLSRRQSGAIASTSGSSPSKAPEFCQTYVHVTAPHKILLWPFMRTRLAEFHVEIAEDLQSLGQDGTPSFLRLEMQKHPHTLPYDVRLSWTPVLDVVPPDGFPRTRFPDLTVEQMATYAQHYFSSFNMLYLLLDRSHFMNIVLPKVSRYGFGDGDRESIIALLVFALGKLALDGTWGEPIDNGTDSQSGLHGGERNRPPGLEIFNEARRRVGFVAHECSMENVQVLLLSAIYYEACGRHLDFWRASQSASTAFLVLIKCAPVDWFSERGNLLKRLYWTCNLIENWYHFDLDLPQTGICDYEDQVPLPGELLGHGTVEDQSTVMHFLAMIALRRLVTRVHKTIFEATSSTAETAEGYGGPPTHVIRELARQLESWRSMLPQQLQWADDPPEARFLFQDPIQSAPVLLFSPNQDDVPVEHAGSLDLITAQLRSRYYYARFMIYRPFVFKALHFPELMTDEDRHLATLCIKSTLMWPIALAPPKDRKRLVPHLYSWTQNFLGILLILRATTISPLLTEICRHSIDETELMLTIQYLLEWIIDVKVIDGIAAWSWKILQPLFRGVFPFIDGVRPAA